MISALLSPALHFAILLDAQFRCVGCGGRAGTVDHVRPRARGGRDVPVNLVALCWDCNRTKSDFWPASDYHPFEGYDDKAEAGRIFEAEIAWLRDHHDEDQIMEELWWMHRDRLSGP